MEVVNDDHLSSISLDLCDGVVAEWGVHLRVDVSMSVNMQTSGSILT